jgi:uncharacterized protein with NAD-binding domain and iron-sulfur cluster
VAIVGGGLAGLSTAVELLDQGYVGGGASSDDNNHQVGLMAVMIAVMFNAG